MAARRQAGSGEIDGYLTGVEPTRRSALAKLRREIRRALPEAEECISYSMPAFRVPGGVVAGFLATKTGCSYFPFSGTALGTLADDIAGYSHTKSALHFDPAKGLPKMLLAKLLRARLAEVAAASSRAQRPSKAPQRSPSESAQPSRARSPAKPSKARKSAKASKTQSTR